MICSLPIKWPKHISMYIEHNPHQALYKSVEEYIGYTSSDDWTSPEEKSKAIKTGELWELTWYPSTPIGSYQVLAASLEALIVFCDEYVN